jgi:hypothetical protein
LDATVISAYCGAHANGPRCPHLIAAANEQYYDRDVSNEGEQQRRGCHAEYYHQYLDRDQPAENVPESTQLRLPDEPLNYYKIPPDFHKN